MAGRAWPFGQLRLPSASRARRPGAYTPDLQWKIFCHAATALGLEISPALTAQSMSFAVSRSPQWGGLPRHQVTSGYSCIISGLVLKMTIS